jgi:phosphatidylglycerol lysyltransferase
MQVRRSGWSRRLRRFAKPALTVAGVALAAFLIHHQVANLTLAKVVHAMLATSPAAAAAAGLATALSYLGLSAVEWIALKALRCSQPAATVWPISLASNAITNSTGFGLATGTLLRLRLYRREHLSLKMVSSLVAVISAANFVSGLAAIGLMLLATLVAPRFALPWPPLLVGAAGAGLLVGAVLVFELIARRHGSAGPWLRLAALAAGVGDWFFSGAALFLLTPRPLVETPAFLVVFTAGSLVGSVIGAPGALGALDVAIFAYHAPGPELGATAGALVVYRVIYFLVPLALALVYLALAKARTVINGR